MNNKEFVSKLKDIVNNYKTVYMWGVFGSPVTESIIAAKSKQYPSWYTAERQASFRKLIGKGYFGFDCVNLIKAILWGWNGDISKTYGGAKYASNGVPDVSADGMLTKLLGVSSDFSKIEIGEAVWIKGHIGIYIGDGKVIECTPKWKNGVQITACLNIGNISGLNGRRWTKHGKLPYITYLPVTEKKPSAEPGNGDSLYKEKEIEELKKLMENLKIKFKDMLIGNKAHWANDNVNSLYEKGIVKGDGEGNFNPDKPITRAEAAALIDRAVKYLDDKINKLK